MSKSQTKSARRLGPQGSRVWHAILDGAEEILRDEGYAALTSRNIAKRADIKQQLIYYYFLTMDDLIVALFHRAAEREIVALESAVAADKPLHGMWEAVTHSQDNKVVSEFTALANRNERLRKEVVLFIKDIRAKQLHALQTILEGKSFPKVDIPLDVLVLISLGLGEVMTRDRELGIVDGHDTLQAMVKQMLSRLEP